MGRNHRRRRPRPRHRRRKHPRLPHQYPPPPLLRPHSRLPRHHQRQQRLLSRHRLRSRHRSRQPQSKPPYPLPRHRPDSRPTPPNGPTISSITASQSTIVEGTSLTLTAIGVSDVGATGIAVTFYEETNGIAGLQTGTNGDFAFTPVTNGSNAISLDTSNTTGTFTFYAQVTDDSGDATPSGTSAPSVTVTVVAPGSAGPSIGSISATPNPVVSGDVLTLTANNITDPDSTVRRVTFYEETNGIPGLQTGPGGDFSFRSTSSSSGFSLQLDTTGVTGSFTFYALAVDFVGNDSTNGTNAPTITVNVTSDALPDTPTNLTANAISTSEINLSFSETNSGQTGFTIQRALDPFFSDFTQLFTINGPSILTYSDTGLDPQTQYFYRVEAFNLAGDSNFSNVADAATPALGTQLAFAQQPPATLTAGASQTIVVDLLDDQGQIATADNSSVTLSIATGPGNATLTGITTVQAVDGIATFSNISLTTAGKYTLLATDPDLISAKTTAFTITPDTSTIHIALAQQPGNFLPDQSIHPPLVLELEDAFGNLITTSAGQAHITLATSPSDAQIKGTLTAAFHKGIATLRNFNLTKAGTYTLEIADPQLPASIPLNITQVILPATTTITVPRTVTARTGKTFTVSAHLHSSAPAPGPGRLPFTGTVTLTDQNNNILGIITVTPTGLARFILSNLAAGTYTCTITYPGDPSHTSATSTPFILIIK